MITKSKDAKFMKRGLPLNLDDRNKIKLYEYLDSRNITGTGIHIIKGDLHTENINSCLKLDYRNVLSLFGASDYSALNFGRNQYGVSYELFVGDNLLRGTFENIQFMIKILRKEGWILNPVDKVVNAILKRCEINNGECPCHNTGEDKHCPCSDYRINDICHCNLYIKK